MDKYSVKNLYVADQLISEFGYLKNIGNNKQILVRSEVMPKLEVKKEPILTNIVKQIFSSTDLYGEIHFKSSNTRTSEIMKPKVVYSDILTGQEVLTCENSHDDGYSRLNFCADENDNFKRRPYDINVTPFSEYVGLEDTDMELYKGKAVYLFLDKNKKTR